MSVRRFVGINSREAMRQVRAALGEDALILSNRTTPEGVEILAMADETHRQLAGEPEPPARPPAPAAAPRPAAPPATAPAARPAAPPAPRPSPGAPASAGSAPPPGASPYQRAASAAAYAAQVPAPSPAAPGIDFAAFSERLLGELQDMRALLNRQASTAAVRSDCGAQLHQRLLGAGFGPCLSAEVLGALPPEFNDAPAGRADVQAWLERQLAARLPVLEDEADLLDAGGVIALVGPTGVGKTTTTAKLAARYVMRHGGSQVALVTTDSFRIGAHEQLRIYARLLGVEVHALAADAPLDGLLQQLADKRLVIIDTVGMSQRDRRLLTQIGQLGAAGRPIRLMLLLNAASHGDTLEEVVDTYQRAALAAGSVLGDCIVSKSDEAARLGPVLDILIRHGLRLNYVATGQQVPEDLQLAQGVPLVREALAVSQPSPFVPQDSAPAGQRLDALSRGLLSQGRTLATLLDSLRREVDGFALLEAAWQLAALPRSVQGERLQQMLASLDQYPPQAGHQLLWARTSAVPGAGWNMPLLAFDAQGRLGVRPWLAHWLPAGQEHRFDWARHSLLADAHLLPGCPEHSVLPQLAASRCAWAGQARGGSRVDYLGERYSLSQLAEVAEPHATLDLRHRGRPQRLELQYVPVQLRAGVKRSDQPGWPVLAWFGRLFDGDAAQPVALRHWLAWSPEPGQQGLLRQADLLRRQLACDDLPSLTLRAWQALGEQQPPLQQELRLFLAAGLAALASRLEQSAEDWAMDVRAQLLGLGGTRRSRGPAQHLDALLHLLAARDAFRQIGALGGGLA